MTRRQLLNSFFCSLNNLDDANALRRNNLTLSDFREIQSLFFVDIAQALRLNPGAKIRVITIIKPVADYFGANGFKVTPDAFGRFEISL